MAKELWIGVDADSEAFTYSAEPIWRDGSYSSLPMGGLIAYAGTRVAAMLGLEPGHKAKLVLDEASVTKGGE